MKRISTRTAAETSNWVPIVAGTPRKQRGNEMREFEGYGTKRPTLETTKNIRVSPLEKAFELHHVGGDKRISKTEGKSGGCQINYSGGME